MISTHHTTNFSKAVGALGSGATLVDILRWRAETQPDKVVYTYLVDGESKEIRLTYRELDREARLIAAHLQSLGASGERALLLYPPGMEFITAFWGCLYAGVVAVPAYPPDPTRLERSLPRLQAMIADAQPMVALTTPSLGAMLRVVRSQNPLLKLLTRLPIPARVGGTFLRKLSTVDTGELQSLNFVTTTNLSPKRLSKWQMPPMSPDTLAYLQYTSGSTGNPKGVMISHANLLANLALGTQLFHLTPEIRGVTWAPLYHDMGLLGYVCGTVYNGFDTIFMSPLHFLQRPVRWLEAISRFGGTHNGAPNFAYELCIRKTTPEQRARLDLSHWRMALNGAEPVRQKTQERFVDAFSVSGFSPDAFYPGFGLAEATLYISGAKNKKAPPRFLHLQATALSEGRITLASPQDRHAQTIMSCGLSGEGHRIVIVDPETLLPCPPNRVGEIWFSGPSVGLGYWNRAQESAETFHAHLADTGEGPFLRTGDLGFLREGELFITGRLKDMIIIRGRNYYPHDIELTVEKSHPNLRPGCGAAFSVDDENNEQLVIVQEVRQQVDEVESNEIMATIRKAVAEEHGLRLSSICLLKARSIPKTSSGKIQRRACRARFLAGSLEVVAACSDDEGTKREQNTAPPPKSGGGPSWDDMSVGQKSERAEAIQAWLVEKLALQLAIPPQEIETGEPFAAYGLDSMAAVNLSTDISDWLGRPLAPTLAYDYPTIAALAQYLAAESKFDTPKSSPIPTSDDEAERKVEPIAIIGIGCRFPGAESPEAFWELLRSGGDAITEVPAERWHVERFYAPEPATAGKMNTRWGGFLEQVDQFDAQFFGISPREVVSMDPQQRLLLEVSWEALEHANLSPTKLAGSQTGVFIGISSFDYYSLLLKAEMDAYFGTGNANSIAANRLSYLLDLRGPSWAVDTACSSSLVALHQACLSLRQGESSLALAGGVNLILSPEATITFSQARMMAHDGRCKTFDAAADGYVRSEGCGVVVLKRLSDAKRDGDQVLALIRGSAVNQDGLSNGLTAPNGPQQVAVIRQALQHAGLSPKEVSYVEAHGTGTALGDPIEVEALGQVFSQNRQTPLMIGSVKTNIGHLEAAAGIAALIKVVLSLQHEQIPPHLHFNTPNPYISWQDLPITIPTQATPWQGGSRIAGVSSFGFGGTNAHVILSQYSTSRGNPLRLPSHLFTFSAKNEAALQALASRYLSYLESNPDISVAELCFTANTGRAHFNHRYALITQSSEQLREQLAGIVAGKDAPAVGVITGQLERAKPKIAFLFTGQGSQYVDMGRELYETEPTFRAAIERCDDILRAQIGGNPSTSGGNPSTSGGNPSTSGGNPSTSGGNREGLPLLSVLYPEEGMNSPLDETFYTQPALFALEYALVQLWKSWGIEPFAVIGHSVGELVAACVAGVFSLEDGLKLIAARGALMQALPAGGEMVVVRADEARVIAAIESEPNVTIAAINGPENTVISGEGEAVHRVVASLEATGIKTKALTVSHAFHSPLMEPILPAFEQIAREVTFHKPHLTLISNLTGGVVSDEVTNAAYWARHIRQPVRFTEGMQSLYEIGANILLEIGPKPTLLGMARQVQGGDGARDKTSLPKLGGIEGGQGRGPEMLPSLRQRRPSAGSGPHGDWQQMLESLAHLYVRGVAVNWAGFYGDEFAHRLHLPTYPFQRKRYWIEGRQEMWAPRSYSRSEHHPLLGQALPLVGTEKIHFLSHLSLRELPYLAHHRVFDAPILPAAAYLEMALAAGAEFFKPMPAETLQIEEVLIPQALILAPDDDHHAENQTPKSLQLVLTPLESGAKVAKFDIFSKNEPVGENQENPPAWTLHATGKITRFSRNSRGRGQAQGIARTKHLFRQPNVGATLAVAPLSDLQANINEALSVTAYYQQFREKGIDYGSSFQAIAALFRDEGQALGLIRLPESLLGQIEPYSLHPVLLDGCFQLIGAAFGGAEQPYLPVGCQRLEYVAPLAKLSEVWCHVELSQSSQSNDFNAALRLFSPSGEVIASVTGLQLKPASRKALLGGREAWQDWLYEVIWQQKPRYGANNYLPAPSDIKAALAPQALKAMRRASRGGHEMASYPSPQETACPLGIAAYEQLIGELEALSIEYVINAFFALGFEFQPHQPFTTAQLAQQLGIVPSYERLFARLLEMLAEVGTLRKEGMQWEVCQVPETPTREAREAASFSIDTTPAELLLLDRCGRNLADVLRGNPKVKPLTLLFPTDESGSASAIYGESAGASAINTLLQKAISDAISRLPAGMTVRVLEIGAGTGGATSYLLPILPPEQTDYLFTDISPLFLTQAEETFRAYPFVRYQSFDVERSPLAQGLESQQYDLIVAANVLHATKDLRQSLSHVYSLLAPGGMLFLQEGTAKMRWLDLTFGLTEGWWHFTDTDLRPDYPLLSTNQWQTLLSERGLTNPQVLSRQTGLSSQQTVIVAQANAERESRRQWLICSDEVVGPQLATLLSQKGEVATLVLPGRNYEQISKQEVQIDPTSPADWKQLLATITQEGQLPLHGIVHLWSLSEPASLEVALKNSCGTTLALIQSLLEQETSPPSLWLVTQGAQLSHALGVHTTRQKGNRKGLPLLPSLIAAPLWGMGKTIALEYSELNCVQIDLAGDAARSADTKRAEYLLEELLYQTAPEEQVAFHQQKRYVARMVRHRVSEEMPQDQPLRLELSARGTLDNLVLKPMSRISPAAGEVEIRVRATGLNFRDVLNALGLYPTEVPLGGECAGEIVALGPEVEGFKVGDAVVALAADSFSHYVTVDAALVAKIAKGLSFEEAATIPIVFLTAYYALHHLAKISAGERLLIHAATGGVGQAAIQLARLAGAEIYATASQGKWDVLKGLGITHIYNSRTLEFAEQIMADISCPAAANHQGVDIVLNSLTSPGFVAASLSVLAPQGRFLEIGKRDVWDAAQVHEFNPSLSYFLIDLADLTQEQPALIQSMLHDLMEQFEAGQLKPLPHKLFDLENAQEAFRYMQQAKHTGKIIISQSATAGILRHDKHLRDDSTYLITGGLGGLGLLVAEFLVERGARHLLLVGRSNPTAAAREQLAKLEQAGATIVVAQADVSQKEQMARIIAEIEPQWPLRGIIHSAGVLSDGTLRTLNWSQFEHVFAPKVQGAFYLHQLSQHLPLDFFVLFSSAASLLGSPGQANHAAANAFLDALAAYRQTLGLPALSINWGAWSKVGAAAKRQASTRIAMQGLESISPDAGLEAFAYLLSQEASQVVVLPINWPRLLKQSSMARDRGLFAMIEAEEEQTRETHPARDFFHQLEGAREGLIETHLQALVSRVLGLKPSQLNREQPLNEVGLDSLMMIELKNNVEMKWGISLPMAELAQSVTVAQLTALVQQQLASQPAREPLHEEAKQPAPKAMRRASRGGHDITHDASAATKALAMTHTAQAMPLAPSQHWLFEMNYKQAHHWNISVLLEVPPELDLLLLQQALHYNLTHHEGLRVRFHKHSTGWQQVISPPESTLGVPFLQIDLSILPDEMKSAAVSAKAAELQGTLDFTKGATLRVIHFDFGKEQAGRLLLISHHLLLDAFGFRLLLNDLFTVYQQLAAGEQMRLPPQKTSYSTYVQRLADHANSPACEQELPLWLELLDAPITPLPLDFPDGTNNIEDLQEESVWMTISESESLLQTLPTASSVHITDILLTALLEAVSTWTGSETLYFETQGHGRNELLPGVDVSRTVCWANTIYPVLLRRAAHHLPLDNLQDVKKQLRRIPNSGLSYGLLRYLNQKPEIRQKLTALPEPDIKFQYHSHLTDANPNQSGSGKLAKESAGNNWGDANQNRARLYIFTYVIAKQLKIELSYSNKLFKRRTMEALGQEIAKQLRRLINGGTSPSTSGTNH